MGGAKGAALALMVELLAVALTGAHFGFEASSFFDEKGGRPASASCSSPSTPVLSPAGISSRAARSLRLDADAGARLPGSRRLALREKAKEQGLEIPQALTARFGLP